MFKLVFKSHIYISHMGLYNVNEFGFYPPNEQIFNIYIIKSGTLSIKVDDEIITANPGEYIFIKTDNVVDYDEISCSKDLLLYSISFTCEHEISNDISFKNTSLPYVIVDKYGQINNFDEIEAMFEKTMTEYKNANLISTLGYLMLLLNMIFQNNSTCSYKVVNPYVHKIKQYIRFNFQRKITLEQLSELTNISATHINHLFHKYEGCTVINYLNQFRIEVAKHYIDQGKFPIEQIATFVGFNSTTYFCKVFKKFVGVSTKQYFRETHSQYFNNFNDNIELDDLMNGLLN